MPLAREPGARRELIAGLRAMVPLVLGAVPFGMSFGARWVAALLVGAAARHMLFTVAVGIIMLLTARALMGAQSSDGGIGLFTWFILILLGAIWGASYLFIKVGGAEIPTFTFVAGRVVIALFALLAVLHLRRESMPRTLREWLPLIAMGVFNGVIPYTLITWGETHIASGMAAILAAAMPLFTVLLAHFWTLDERLTAAKILGIAVGFFGVVVLFVPELKEGVQMEFWGQLAVVVAAASYAAAILVARKYLGGVSHLVASAGQLAAAALWMVPLSLAFENPFALRPSLAAMGSLLTLALPGTAFAYVLYYWLIENTGATRTSLVTYLIPMTGVIWGAVFLHEPLEWEAIVGLLFIIAGIGLVNRRSVSMPRATLSAPAQGK